jgi:dihydrodipicolinate synthase/N-acetylneuraminate lyase
MQQKVTPRGLICSLALVSDPNDNDRYLGLESLIARLQPAVSGLFLDPMFWCPDANHCGPVSASLLEEVIGLVPPGLPLWVRITGRTAEQTINICRQLETVCRRLNYKAPLAWVDTPLYYHSNRGLPDHYRTLLSETEFDLIIDNNPQLIRQIADKTKRKNIRTAILKRLSNEPRLAGLLHRGDLRRSTNYQRAVRGRSNFLVYDAGERSFLEKPSASGVVSVGANLLPHDWRTITLASLNLDESHQARSRFLHLWETGLRVRTLQKYYGQAPARIIPAVLTAWGFIRENGHPLSPEEQKAVDRILEHIPEP